MLMVTGANAPIGFSKKKYGITTVNGSGPHHRGTPGSPVITYATTGVSATIPTARQSRHRNAGMTGARTGGRLWPHSGHSADGRPLLS